MAKYTIRILNYSFTISSDDEQSYMDSVAARVERRVKRLSDEMPSRNMTEVALFVAMDYCDQYMKSVGDGSNLRGQIKDYLQESGYARKQLEETKKENELLKAEIEALRSRLSSNNNGVAAPVESTELTDTQDFAEGYADDFSEEYPKDHDKKSYDKKKNSSKSKKKLKKSENAPIQGIFSDDAFAESADATAEIMSFFEQKAFDDDDDED